MRGEPLDRLLLAGAVILGATVVLPLLLPVLAAAGDGDALWTAGTVDRVGRGALAAPAFLPDLAPHAAAPGEDRAGPSGAVAPSAPGGPAVVRPGASGSDPCRLL